MKFLSILIATILLAPVVYLGAQPSGPGASGERPTDDYVIQPTDVLKFRVYGEPDTDTDVRVSADGMVSLPYLRGPIRLSGMTLQEAHHFLYEEYNRDIYVNPQIYLVVTSYSERRVQVMGQVNRPGMVVIPPEESFTLLQAIAGAGGFTRLANRREVTVKRQTEDGETRILNVNVDQIMKDPETSDWEIREGDTILVRERIF